MFMQQCIHKIIYSPLIDMSVMGVAIRMQADAILRIIRTRERERERERESEREIGDKVTTVTEVHVMQSMKKQRVSSGRYVNEHNFKNIRDRHRNYTCALYWTIEMKIN